MCGEGKVNYTQKYLCGCSVIMLVIIVILSLVINFGGNSGNSVEMSGENGFCSGRGKFRNSFAGN